MERALRKLYLDAVVVGGGQLQQKDSKLKVTRATRAIRVISEGDLIDHGINNWQVMYVIHDYVCMYVCFIGE